MLPLKGFLWLIQQNTIKTCGGVVLLPLHDILKVATRQWQAGFRTEGNLLPLPSTETRSLGRAVHSLVTISNEPPQLHNAVSVSHFVIYASADKSLARPGRKQARKHVRDARDFNNIETRAVNFFSLQGKAPKEIHAILTETLACFLPGRAKDLSASP